MSSDPNEKEIQKLNEHFCPDGMIAYKVSFAIYNYRVEMHILKKSDEDFNAYTTAKCYKNYFKETFNLPDECFKNENTDYFLIEFRYSFKDKFLENQDDLINYHKTRFNSDYKKLSVELRSENIYGKEDQRFLRFNSNESEINKFRNKVLQILAQKGSQTDNRMFASEYLVELVKTKTYFYSIRNDSTDELWVYEDGIYVPNGISYIQEFCRLVLAVNYTNTFCNLVTNKVLADSFIDEDEFFDNETDPDLVVVRNGILNMRTRELTTFDPEQIFLSKIDIIYDPDKKCEKIIEFLKQILEDEDDLITMQEIFGFLPRREYTFERCIMLLGDGRNGKGKLSDLFKYFIGTKSCANLQPTIFEDPNNFSVSNLHCKLANISMDINPTALKNTGMLKSLSGRDLITVPRKFKTPISFTNYAKMIFAANTLPMVYDSKSGIWERWILINFNYQFVPEHIYKNTPKEDRKFMKIRDPDIIKKIVDPDQLSGLLNWALDGFNNAVNRKQLHYKYTPTEVKSIWVRKSDSFRAFFMDSLTLDYDFNITKPELLKAYSDYCKEHNIRMVSEKILHRLLTEEGVMEGRPGANADRIWKGVRFKERCERIDYTKIENESYSYYQEPDAYTLLRIKMYAEKEMMTADAIAEFGEDLVASALTKGILISHRTNKVRLYGDERNI